MVNRKITQKEHAKNNLMIKLRDDFEREQKTIVQVERQTQTPKYYTLGEQVTFTRIECLSIIDRRFSEGVEFYGVRKKVDLIFLHQTQFYDVQFKFFKEYCENVFTMKKEKNNYYIEIFGF